MDKSLVGRLEAALRPLPYVGLRIQEEEDGLEIVRGDQPPILNLAFRDGEWILYAADGHAHLESSEEGTDLAYRLLSGEARFASEYRGDTLATAWIEQRDGESFVVRDRAIFLSPFDADEWELWPGEAWRVVRKTLDLDSPEGAREFDHISEESTFGAPSMASWIEAALGAPEEGMKWVVGGYNRFVFQVPHGWRRVPSEGRERHDCIDFASPTSNFVLRARAYFRDAAEKAPERCSRAQRPNSVEHQFQDPSETDAAWANHRWTLLFTDGQEEMMGILELFCPVGDINAVEPLRLHVDASTPAARFVPSDWKMGEEA